MSLDLTCAKCGTTRPLAEVGSRRLILRSCCRAALGELASATARAVAMQNLLLLWDEMRQAMSPAADAAIVDKDPLMRALAHGFRQESGAYPIEREPEKTA